MVKTIRDYAVLEGYILVLGPRQYEFCWVG